MLIEHHPSHLH
jgi:hypothetical protein